MKSIRVVAAIIRNEDRYFATQRGSGSYKDWWEFPGGKIEPGETPQEALKREILEELDTEIVVGDYICTVEYDYPEFHLTMLCFWATIANGTLTLREHEAAQWLKQNELETVNWLPADQQLIELIKEGSNMTLLESIDARHSVRAYKDQPVPAELRAQMDAFVAELNAESGLAMRVVWDDPAGFASGIASYGGFKDVSNYILLAGEPSADFDYKCGWYGEAAVLNAQQLGLNTCWTALTFNKKHVKRLVPQGQDFCMVISLGYGQTQGVPHKGKSAQDVSAGTLPEWFGPGIEAALKAPTAMNQQKFLFAEEGGQPVIKVKGIGVHTKVDLGIAAYHFWAATGVKPRAL